MSRCFYLSNESKFGFTHKIAFNLINIYYVKIDLFFSDTFKVAGRDIVFFSCPSASHIPRTCQSQERPFWRGDSGF
jgi:hypothetical protein